MSSAPEGGCPGGAQPAVPPASELLHGCERRRAATKGQLVEVLCDVTYPVLIFSLAENIGGCLGAINKLRLSQRERF